MQKLKESLIINVNNFEAPELRTYGKLVYTSRVSDKFISHSENKRKELTSIDRCKENAGIFDHLKN